MTENQRACPAGPWDANGIDAVAGLSSRVTPGATSRRIRRTAAACSPVPAASRGAG
jgi:hypothetical protein